MDSKRSCASRGSAQYGSDFAQADTVSELVDVELSECARFVDSLGLPLLKAKKLLAALRGAAQAEVCPPCAPTYLPRPVHGMRQTCALGLRWLVFDFASCLQASVSAAAGSVPYSPSAPVRSTRRACALVTCAPHTGIH